MDRHPIYNKQEAANVQFAAMKKADFNLGVEATSSRASRRHLQDATRVMESHKNVLQATGVVGMWVGAKASRPYIMVAVSGERGEELRQSIPDSIDGVSVYYIEGNPKI